MSKYEIYKPSGIDWIGNYPKHWEFRRLKNVCSVNKEALTDKTPFDYLIEYIDIGNTNDKGEFLELQEIEFSEAPSRARRKVEDGDTIISTVRTYLRAIAFIEQPKENLIVSTGFAVLNPIKKTLVPKFLFYQVLCDSFIQRVIANSEGVSYPAISSTKLADLKLFIPSTTEQLTIANYLDDQTQNIDHLIANKKAQAEKLKELRQIEINIAITKGLNPNAALKDSGIDWLGEIPKHWEVKRLKDLVNRIGDGIHSTPNYVDVSEIYFVNGNNLINGEIKIFDNTDCIDEAEFLKYKLDFNLGTLLISINGTIGNLAFYKGEKIVLGKSAAYIDYTSKLHNYYLYYFLQSFMVSNIFELSFSGTTIKNLSLFTMRNLRMFLPPKEEQIQIASYLQGRTNAIDKLITNVENQIEKLQELRKIKIYEAVTGKIKVNAYGQATA